MPGYDVDGSMYAYKDYMMKYDLSAKAIQDFAYAIRLNDLAFIKAQFARLDAEQIKGLLTIIIDYKKLGYGDLMSPFGYPIELAKRWNFTEIEKYLLEYSKVLRIESEATQEGGWKSWVLTLN